MAFNFDVRAIWRSGLTERQIALQTTKLKAMG